MDLDKPGTASDRDDERREVFDAAQAVSRDEYMAELVAASIAANKVAFTAISEGFAFLEGMDATRPLNAKLASAFREALVEMGTAFAKGQRTPEALSGPFAGGLNGSSGNSSSPNPSVSPVSSPPEAQSPTLPAPRMGPGRPLGSKNKTKSERNGRPHSGPGESNGRP